MSQTPGAFGIAATGLEIIGPLLLLVAVIRAKVFPSSIGIPLMVAGVLSPVITSQAAC